MCAMVPDSMVMVTRLRGPILEEGDTMVTENFSEMLS